MPKLQAHTASRRQQVSSRRAAGWTDIDALVTPYLFQYYSPVFSRNGQKPVQYHGLYSGDVIADKGLAQIASGAQSGEAGGARRSCACWEERRTTPHACSTRPQASRSLSTSLTLRRTSARAGPGTSTTPTRSSCLETSGERGGLGRRLREAARRLILTPSGLGAAKTVSSLTRGPGHARRVQHTARTG